MRIVSNFFMPKDFEDVQAIMDDLRKVGIDPIAHSDMGVSLLRNGDNIITDLDIEIDVEIHCEDFTSCEDCDDKEDDECSAGCPKFDPGSSTCQRCENFEEGGTRCDDCECRCTDNGLNEDCEHYDICNRGGVSDTIRIKDLNFAGTIVFIGKHGLSKVIYECELCGALGMGNGNCFQTYRMIKAAENSEIPVTPICEQCFNAARLCTRLNAMDAEHEKPKKVCWTQDTLKEAVTRDPEKDVIKSFWK